MWWLSPLSNGVEMALNLTPGAKAKIKSTRQAFSIFENVYEKELYRGRIVAIKIALKHGTCSSRQVILHMIWEGSLVEDDDSTQYWVSAIFAKDDWEWVPDGWTSKQKKSKKTQGGWRPNKVWRLTPQAIEKYQHMERYQWP